jgi:hypothetical protein
MDSNFQTNLQPEKPVGSKVRYIVWGLVILAVIGAGIWLNYGRLQSLVRQVSTIIIIKTKGSVASQIPFVGKSQTTTENGLLATTTPFKKTDVPTSDLHFFDKGILPTGFPADLPYATSTQQNFNFTENLEKFSLHKSVKDFVSPGTVESSFKLYSDYLKNNGWNPQTLSPGPSGVSFLAGSKNSKNIFIFIDKNGNDANSVVVKVELIFP